MAMAATNLVLLIQVDALRGDYVTEQDAPFLFGLAQEGVSGSLRPTFGFEPDAAYLAGLYPDECDGGAHYWFEPEATPFSIARYLPNALDRLPPFPKKVFRKLLTEWVRHTTDYKYETVANIPLSILPYIAPADKQLPYEPAYPDRPTLFSLCDEHDIPWLFHASPAYPVGIEAGVARLKQDLKPSIGFAFWHIGDLDKAGHRFGPDSSERRAAMRQVDAGIRQVFTFLRERYEQVQAVIIGDHGMATVRGAVDVQGALAKGGIRQHQGLLYFLDSTMARFWFFDEDAKTQVVAILEKLEGGRMLGPTDLDHYHLNYGHNRFGDLFFLADPNMLISPNFYQDGSVVKGMHGYAPEFPEQQSAFMVYASGLVIPRSIDTAVDMRCIFPTVLELLSLDKLSACRVASIIKGADDCSQPCI